MNFQELFQKHLKKLSLSQKRCNNIPSSKAQEINNSQVKRSISREVSNNISKFFKEKPIIEPKLFGNLLHKRSRNSSNSEKNKSSEAGEECLKENILCGKKFVLPEKKAGLVRKKLSLPTKKVMNMTQTDLSDEEKN